MAVDWVKVAQQWAGCPILSRSLRKSGNDAAGNNGFRCKRWKSDLQ